MVSYHLFGQGPAPSLNCPATESPVALPWGGHLPLASLKSAFCCSVTQLFLILCYPVDCSTSGFPVHHHLPELAQTHVHWWRHPTVSSSVIPFSSRLQSFPVSGSFPMSWLFTSGGWSFSFSISSSNEYAGLISFRMDWLDLLAVQGTLKSLLQHHSSKASILQCSAFLIAQLSHPYMTTGKTIDWNRLAFVGKVMSLLFNTIFIKNESYKVTKCL